MNIIALLNPFEAVTSGDTMIVQFPSDHNQYTIDGKLMRSTYNRQIAMDVNSEICRYTPPKKTLAKVIAADGVEYTAEERSAELSRFLGEDGEAGYPSLEVEFEHRKLLQNINDGEMIYDVTDAETTPVEVTVVGEYVDTGSKFITTPLIFGKGRFYTSANSFYKVNVAGVIGDTIKTFAEENNLKFENSTHSGFRYAKVDGSYVIPKEWELDSQKGERVLPTLEAAKQFEGEVRQVISRHLRAKFNIGRASGILISELYSELVSISNLLDKLDVKQKSVQTKHTVREKLVKLRNRLGNE